MGQMKKIRGIFREQMVVRVLCICDLEFKVWLVQGRLAQIAERMDDADSYERRDTLVISGSGVPHTSNGEKGPNLVTNILKERLHLNFAASDVSACHQLGQRPATQPPDNRNIIVKL